MRPRARIALYAALAVVGAVGTWAFNLRFSADHGGFDPILWIKGGFANAAGASLAVDFYVSMVAGIVFMLAEARRIRMKRVWIYVALLAVAWAVSLPLFLLARERHLARQKT